jgi:hypothetical protein
MSGSRTRSNHASTGGKVKQKGLSKKGDRYLRSLLVNGAMAVVRQAQKRPDKHPWVAKLLGRMSAKQAAIAIANKTARIAWVLMVRGGVYEAGHRAPSIERRRARLPDKRLGDGGNRRSPAHDCNARARGTRRKASRVAEVLMA